MDCCKKLLKSSKQPHNIRTDKEKANVFAECLNTILTPHPDCIPDHTNIVRDLIAKARSYEHNTKHFFVKHPYIKVRSQIQLLEKQKSKTRTHTSSYRPISLPFSLTKVLEKMILNHIYTTKRPIMCCRITSLVFEITLQFNSVTD